MYRLLPPRRLLRSLSAVAVVVVEASPACRSPVASEPVLLQERSRLVRSLQADVAEELPPLISPNPEPAEPPSFAVLAPAAVQAAAIEQPEVRTVPPQDIAPLPADVSAGALGVAINASVPDSDPEVPSALGEEILNGPWPAPAARNQSKSAQLPVPAPEAGTGTPLPYYIVVNTTTTPTPTIAPLPNLTAEELTAQAAERASAALDCTLGAWGDWSACKQATGDNLKSRVQTRSRVIIQPQMPGGSVCDPGNMTQITQCLSEEGAKELQQKLVPTEKTDDTATP